MTYQDPDVEIAADDPTSDVVFAAPDWTMERAAEAMVTGGFRHLVVIENGEWHTHSYGCAEAAGPCKTGPLAAQQYFGEGFCRY